MTRNPHATLTQPDGSNLQQPSSDPLVKIAIMGATGSGKTSFVNLASGSNLRVQPSSAKVQLANPFTLDGRRVVLIDTPGFDDTSMSDTDNFRMIADFLETTYKEGAKLAGVIYIHSIANKQFTAKQNFGVFHELCGDTTFKNVILVTNMWGDVSHDVGEDREQELVKEFFRPVLDKGAKMVRHYDTWQSAHDIIREILENQPDTLPIQVELVDEGENIVDTAAGEIVNRDLKELTEKHEATLTEFQEDMKQTLKRKDEERQQELEEQAKEEQIAKVKKELEEVTSKYAAEKERMETEMKKMEERMFGVPVTIPIHRASGDETEVGRIEGYRSINKVSEVREKFLDDAHSQALSSSPQDGEREIYFEILLHGQEEGQFLEDSSKYDNITMDQICKLVCWTRDDIKRTVTRISKEVTEKLRQSSTVARNLGSYSEVCYSGGSSMIRSISAGYTDMVAPSKYYQQILSIRQCRDSTGDGGLSGTVGLFKSFFSNTLRVTSQ